MIKEVHICDRCGRVLEQCDIVYIPTYTIMYHEHGWGEVRRMSLDLCSECQREYDIMIHRWLNSPNNQLRG